MMYDNDFEHEEVGDVSIETLNFARATLKEVNVFRDLLNAEHGILVVNIQKNLLMKF